MKRNFKKIITVFALCAVSAFAAMASGCSLVDDLKEKIDNAKAEKALLNELEEAKELELLCLGTGTFGTPSNTFYKNEKSPWYFFNVINTSDYDELVIKMKTDTLTAKVKYVDEEDRDAFAFYDLDNSSGWDLSDMPFEIDMLYEDEDYSYASFDVSEMGEVCFCVDEQSSDVVQAWLR